MATQKPISTISYNSEAFLREKLESWLAAHIIQSYMYICHKGEDGDKDHIHLRIEPNKKLDPMDLTDALKEYVKDNDKPLGVRPWRPSKEEDWLLYAVHNADYLKLKYGGGDKGEKLPYEWQDIKASDGFDVEVAHIRALSALKHSNVNLASRLQQGANPLSLVAEGENVFVVNALNRALYANDYSRLVTEHQDLQREYQLILYAIQDAGLQLVPLDDGGYKLTARNGCAADATARPNDDGSVQDGWIPGDVGDVV